MKKVAWPNRANVFSSTKIVIITTIISAVLLWLVDLLLMRLVTLIF